MSPVEISAIIFSSVFASSLIGMWLRGILPEHHLSAETKDLVKLGVGLVGTMAALLLGLLVASQELLRRTQQRAHPDGREHHSPRSFACALRARGWRNPKDPQNRRWADDQPAMAEK